MYLLLEADIKAKINNLRTHFSMEVFKVKASNKSGAGTDDVYESK